MKLSVIVPVYNAEKMLAQCVDSLLAQTLKEMEIILVNDASPDNSIALMREYEARYPDRVIVIDSKVNLRQGGARMLGIHRARGEYITCVDNDDYLDPNAYERMYQKAKELDCDLVRCGCARFLMQDGREEELAPIPVPPAVLEIDGLELTDALREILILEGCPHYTAIYKRSIVVENHIEFPAHLVYDDNYFIKLLPFYMNRIGCIEELFYHNRVHATSASHLRNAPWLLDRMTVECLLQDELHARGLQGRCKDAMEYMFLFLYCFNTLRLWSCQSTFLFPKETLKVMREEMRRRAPGYRQNKYYKKRLTFLRRLVVETAMRSDALYYAYDKAVQFAMRLIGKKEI